MSLQLAAMVMSLRSFLVEYRAREALVRSTGSVQGETSPVSWICGCLGGPEVTNEL